MLNKVKMWAKDKNNWIGWLYLIPLFVLMIMFTIVPLVQSFYKSFVTHPYASNYYATKIGLDNFKNVLSDINFGIAIKNSTIILFVATAISFVIAFIVSLAIESLIFKFSRTTFLTIIYSQFFISGFAVGIAFVYLFGEKNVFFKMFNHPEISFRFGKVNIVWYYIIFQVWRSLPFNIILFAAAINRANIKYSKQMKLDNLNTWNRIKDIYFIELKTTIFAIIITNFIFAFLLYPQMILDNSFDMEYYHGHTVTSYILKYLGVPNPSYLNQAKTYAASVLVLLYVLILSLIFSLLRPKFIKKVYLKLKNISYKLKNKGVKNAYKNH